MKTQLDTYRPKDYHPGSRIKRSLWYIVSLLFFRTGLPFPSALKRFLLLLFGAKVGKKVVIKPGVHIKHPWYLSIGDYSWIGENVWIDNLKMVTIGAHCCLSQGCYLLCGNHDYSKSSFDLITRPIHIEDGCWIGAFGIVAPGVACRSHSVLAAGSVAVGDIEEYTVYQGNPATFKRKRVIHD